MVEYIRSKYLKKILLSSLNEKTKLDLIKYNKNMKNKLDITLKHYKYHSKKYI